MQFLQVYVVLLVLPAAIGGLWRQVQFRTRPRDTRHRWTVYHLAYLAGGRRRVVETAVAALLDSGDLRTSSSGELTQASKLRPSDPVEALVFTAAHRRRIPELVQQARGVTRRLVADLRDAGLVVSEGAIRLRRCVVFALTVVVLLAGLARLGNEASRGHAYGTVLVLVVIAVLVAAGTALMIRYGRRNLTTAAGLRLVRQAKGTQLAPVTGDHTALLLMGSGVAAAVAVSGLQVITDKELVGALTTVPPPAPAGWTGVDGNEARCGT